MPFSSEHNVVYGIDARRIPTWGRGVLVAFIDGKLNDEEGPYFEPLALDSTPVLVPKVNDSDPDEYEWTRKALVTASAKLAAQRYPKAATDPVVFVNKGPKPDWQPSGKTIGDRFYEGKRVNLCFEIDSAYDKDNGTLIEQEEVDSTLADFVVDILERGADELAALGLNNICVETDSAAQQAGTAKNPIRVLCFVKSLDDWTP